MRICLVLQITLPVLMADHLARPYVGVDQLVDSTRGEATPLLEGLPLCSSHNLPKVIIREIAATGKGPVIRIQIRTRAGRIGQTLTRCVVVTRSPI